MNINGYCPHCKVSFDGELIVDTFIEQGNTREEAIKSASHYAGWEQHGELNRWSNKISIYDIDRDRTVQYKCNTCGEVWKR
jgi:hypothetical protein